jgi:hypothetical protein
MLSIGYVDNSVHVILPPQTCLEFIFDGVRRECEKQISVLKNLRLHKQKELEEKKVSKEGKSNSDKN